MEKRKKKGTKEDEDEVEEPRGRRGGGRSEEFVHARSASQLMMRT